MTHTTTHKPVKASQHVEHRGGKAATQLLPQHLIVRYAVGLVMGCLGCSVVLVGTLVRNVVVVASSRS
eukprot:3432184-Pleurochrysis_carterae.AAC.1